MSQFICHRLHICHLFSVHYYTSTLHTFILRTLQIFSFGLFSRQQGSCGCCLQVDLASNKGCIVINLLSRRIRI